MYFSTGVAELLYILLQHELYMNMYAVLYFSLPKISLSTQCSTPSESCISLWSMRIAWQQSKNSAAAQALIGIKCHTSEIKFSVKLWLQQTCQTSHQHTALKAEGRKFQYQPVGLGVWHGLSFSLFSPLVLLTYPRAHNFVLPMKLVNLREESPY